MIAYIRGTLAYIEPEESMAVLETGGIGYRILMSGRDLDLLPAAGEELRLYTYLQVRIQAKLLSHRGQQIQIPSRKQDSIADSAALQNCHAFLRFCIS